MSVKITFKKENLKNKEGLSLIQNIKKDLTYKDKEYFLVKDNKDKITFILPFYYATTNLKLKEIKNTLTPISFEKLTLREDQHPILKEVLDNILKTSTSIIEIPPGKGKTTISLCAALQLNLFPILIVIPSKISSLPKQWKDTIINRFGYTEDDIYETETFSKEDKSNTLITSNYKFIISKDTRVLKEVKVGTLIADEVHLLATYKKYINVFMNIFPQSIIFLSATVERVDEEHLPLYFISGAQTIKRKPNHPYLVKIWDCPYEINIKLQFNTFTKKMDYLQYCKDLSENEHYNKTILDILSSYNDKKFIILTKLVDHVHFLKKIIEEKLKEETSILCGSTKTHLDRRILIGTIPKLSTGYDCEMASIDYKGISPNALILVHPIKHPQLFEQCKGRVTRDSKIIPIIFSIKIPFLKFSSKHILNLSDYIINNGGQFI